MASTHGPTSSAVGSMQVAGVRRSGSGSGRTVPASPITSGRPPRAEAITGMPLISASTAGRACPSHPSDGISAMRVTPQ